MLSYNRKHRCACRLLAPPWLHCKRGGGVLHSCYCHYHIGSEDCTVRAFKALRLDLKYLAHKHSVFKFIIYNCFI